MNYRQLPIIAYAAEGGAGAAQPDPDANIAEEEVEESEEPEAGAESQEDAEEETEEAEIDGRKYMVPKSLKPHLMMEKDYRHKTMEVAERARAFEAQQAAHAEKVKADEQFAVMTRQFTKEIAQRENIAAQIEHYEKKVDWARWRQENPEQALQGTLEYQDLLRQKNVLDSEINTKVGAMRQREQTVQKAAMDAYERELPLKIKDWSPAKKEALKARATKTYGLSPADFDGINSSVAMHVLADADAYHQLLATLNKTPKPSAAEPAKPIPKVKTVARAVAEPSERDSDAEWVRKRNAQIEGRRKANLIQMQR